MKQTTAALIFSGLGLAGITFHALPAEAQSAAPQITVTRSGDAGAPVGAAPAPAATAGGGEVLPWADKPLAPVAGIPEADTAAAEAASAQCGGLFEAACRDLKTCAWVADISRGDGTVTPAHCLARPAAPPKKAAKKNTTPAKKTAAPVEKKAAAPAVKAAVTRIEDEEPAAVRAVAAEAPAPKKTPPVVTTEKPQPEPKPQVKAAATPKASEEPAAQPPEKPAEAQAAAKPPAPQAQQAPKQASPMPSFGSISGFGTGNAVVVTVPPPASSE